MNKCKGQTQKIKAKTLGLLMEKKGILLKNEIICLQILRAHSSCYKTSFQKWDRWGKYTVL